MPLGLKDAIDYVDARTRAIFFWLQHPLGVVYSNIDAGDAIEVCRDDLIGKLRTVGRDIAGNSRHRDEMKLIDVMSARVESSSTEVHFDDVRAAFGLQPVREVLSHKPVEPPSPNKSGQRIRRIEIKSGWSGWPYPDARGL